MQVGNILKNLCSTFRCPCIWSQFIRMMFATRDCGLETWTRELMSMSKTYFALHFFFKICTYVSKVKSFEFIQCLDEISEFASNNL